MFFISLQKLFLLSRKSNFSILVIQISWYHQMPKHETRSTFYWKTWEVNMVCYWNLASFCHITKEESLSKNSTNTATWKLVPGFLCKQRIKHNLYWKLNFLKQGTYNRYLLVKLSKFVQISTLTFSDSFFTEDSLKIKRAWN